MQILEAQERPETLVRELMQVWEKSVRTTHLFLSEREIGKIIRYLPQALQEVAHLLGQRTKPAARLPLWECRTHLGNAVL